MNFNALLCEVELEEAFFFPLRNKIWRRPVTLRNKIWMILQVKYEDFTFATFYAQSHYILFVYRRHSYSWRGNTYKAAVIHDNHCHISPCIRTMYKSIGNIFVLQYQPHFCGLPAHCKGFGLASAGGWTLSVSWCTTMTGRPRRHNYQSLLDKLQSCVAHWTTVELSFVEHMTVIC